MSTLRRFLSRRWLLAFTGSAALLFGLAMLHPYPRQSLFGPKIDGVPWCAWENKVRCAAAPELSDGFLFALAEKLGLVESIPPGGPNLPRGPEFLPLYLQLANDHDLRVRRISLQELHSCVKIDDRARWAADRNSEILALFRRHVEGDDPLCRMICANYLWRAVEDRNTIKVHLAFCDHTDRTIQHDARISLCWMAEADLDASFEPVSRYAEDKTRDRDARITRLNAIRAMSHFGKRGFPVIRNALKDPDRDVQFAGLTAIERLGVDAQELRPDLAALQESKEPHVRFRAQAILKMIDAGRMPAQPKLDD